MKMECIKNLDKCKAECCKTLSFKHYSLSEDLVRYYRLHGCTVDKVEGKPYHILIPMKCPQLDENDQCKIYNDRPETCKNFVEENKKGYYIPPKCIICNNEND